MKKSLIGTLILGILIGVGATYALLNNPEKVPAGKPELQGSIVLSQRYPDGSLRDTGVRVPYDFTGTFPAASLRLSPDKTKVAYSVWENTRVAIYVTDTNGANTKKLAEQSVPEGSGGLNIESIRWSEDGKEITYVETGIGCPKKNPNCQMSDWVSEQTVYAVNVMTGAKRVMPMQ